MACLSVVSITGQSAQLKRSGRGLQDASCRCLSRRGQGTRLLQGQPPSGDTQCFLVGKAVLCGTCGIPTQS